MNWKFWKNNNEKRSNYNYTPVYTCNYNMGIKALGLTNNANAISLSAVYSAVEMISNSIAELPIKVKQRIDNKNSVIENHQVYMALTSGVTPRFMLIKMMIWDMLLYGNGYAHIKRAANGTPLELVYLPANTVNVIWNKKREQPVYMCTELGKKPIEGIDMLHIYKNSTNGWLGIGILSYAKPTIDLSQYTEKTAQTFFKSGLNVGGILTSDAPRLTDKQRDEIRNAWAQSHTGDNMNGLAVLDSGFKYQQVTVNSRDAQLIETRLFNLQEVARFFNISPCLLGDLSKSGYSTVEASSTEFVLHTLMPLITMLQEEFTRKLLLPNEKKTQYIDFEEDYLIKADKISTASYLNTLVSRGIISINEARQKLGLNSIDGGDEHFIPYTDIEQNKISNATNTLNEENGEE